MKEVIKCCVFLHNKMFEDRDGLQMEEEEELAVILSRLETDQTPCGQAWKDFLSHLFFLWEILLLFVRPVLTFRTAQSISPLAGSSWITSR
eukprot:IDg2376t1